MILKNLDNIDLDNFPVAIFGSGPAGITTALELEKKKNLCGEVFACFSFSRQLILPILLGSNEQHAQMVMVRGPEGRLSYSRGEGSEHTFTLSNLKVENFENSKIANFPKKLKIYNFVGKSQSREP